jgi:uncharacterized membrane protein
MIAWTHLERTAPDAERVRPRHPFGLRSGRVIDEKRERRIRAPIAEPEDCRVQRTAVLCTALVAAAFLAGTYLAPLMEQWGIVGGDLLRRGYAPVCHQIPSRSFEIGHATQAVCARCAGLYWGGVAGLLAGACLLVGRRRGPRPVWLAIAVAPSVVDALLPWLGLPALPIVPRHLLAWPAGLAAGLFLAIGVADLANSMRTGNKCDPRGLRANSVLEGSDG